MNYRSVAESNPSNVDEALTIAHYYFPQAAMETLTKHRRKKCFVVASMIATTLRLQSMVPLVASATSIGGGAVHGVDGNPVDFPSTYSISEDEHAMEETAGWPTASNNDRPRIEGSHGGGRLRRRKRALAPSPNSMAETNLQQRRRAQSSPTCIGPTLNPGDTIHPNEYLCYGTLRFGINDQGLFVLGFASDESDAAPAILAWKAVPTTLFVDASQPFSYVTLSPNGNLLGYDDNGVQIFDSNYDYYDRLSGKQSGSTLALSGDCHEAASEEDGAWVLPHGEMCARLTSPSEPGMPYGDVTWGVVVDGGMNEGQPASTSAPRVKRTKKPTTSPTVHRAPSRQPSSETIQSDSYATPETTSVIWGFVWLDSNSNAEMDSGEAWLNSMQVELHGCSESDKSSYYPLIDTAYTDDNGMYFFQVPNAQVYRARFVVNTTMFGYSSSEKESSDTNVMDVISGWTMCELLNDTIQWNAGLFSKESDDGNEDENGASNGGKLFGKLPSTDSTQSNTPQMDAAPEAAEPATSSIGGSIFIDFNENGIIDPVESLTSAQGYTVPDNTMTISLTDCTTETVLDTIEGVEFPGKYSFHDLMEGGYKVGFDIVPSNATKASAKSPTYSFIDKNSSVKNDEKLTSYITECIKLTEGKNNDSVNAGVTPSPLAITTKSAEAELDLPTSSEASDESANESNVQTNSVQDANTNEGSGKKSFVAPFIGVMVTISLVAVGLLFFVKKRGELSTDTFQRFFRGSVDDLEGDDGALDNDDIRAASATKCDLSAAASETTGGPTIGSLCVETASSVEGNMEEIESDTGNDSSSDDDDSDSGSSSSSDDGSDSDAENSNVQQQSDKVKVDTASNRDSMKARKSTVELDQHRYQHPYANRNWSDDPLDMAADDASDVDDRIDMAGHQHKHQQTTAEQHDSNPAAIVQQFYQQSQSNKQDYIGTNFEDTSNASYQHHHGSAQQYQEHNQSYTYYYSAAYQHQANTNDYCNEAQGATSNQHYYHDPKGAVHQQTGQHGYPYHYSMDGISHNVEHAHYYEKSQSCHASVSSSRSADPPAASYRELPEYSTEVDYALWTSGSNQAQDHHVFASSEQCLDDNECYDYNKQTSYDSDYSESSDSSSEMSGWFSSSTDSSATSEVKGTTSRPTSSTYPANYSASVAEDWGQMVTPNYNTSSSENLSVGYNPYMIPTSVNNVALPGTDDNKSVVSAGSDQSADPPGASYTNLRQYPPPPPPRRR